MTDGSVGGSAPSHEKRLSAALFRWATGDSRAVAGRVMLCGTLEAFHGIASRGNAADVYLVPSGHSRLPDGVDHGQVLTFDGRFDEPGDVIHIGNGYEIELKDYVALPFMPVTRPTIVACTTSTAWRALIEDAEEALAHGVFIPQLASPATVLSDRVVLDAAIEGTSVGIDRLTIADPGSVRYRLGGAVAGTVATADLRDQSASVVLESDGEPSGSGLDLEKQLAARPWIRQYLTALRVAGGKDGGTWKISGFGDRLTASEGGPGARTSAHLIIWRGDEYRLVAESGRRFLLDRESAVAVDSLLRSSSRREAIDAAREAGLLRSNLEAELDHLCRRLAAVGVVLEPSEGEEP
ncbi:MAG: hypothetical protein K0R99_1992 [Microbacterium sp.]|jgi:hypothetical protein|uniref:daptide biosynthesis RiPP recognition protein n=1 Tax=Microbacterium sp. TaxID=51671 RepID=UPI0026178539|nr:daptide biosynthesis RiPP recognition protein [Microbacterium sp.]MDF2560546.1 hypothetical protein [Microbacterium sp.]